MTNYLTIIGLLNEENDVMTCEFLTNEANATFNQNSVGVAEIITDGFFKDKKVVAFSKPTYGSASEDCILDTVSFAPDKITIASTVNGVQVGNVFKNTPFVIYVKIP